MRPKNIPEHVTTAAKEMIRGEIGVREYLDRIDPETRAIGDIKLLVAIGAFTCRPPSPAQLRYLGLVACGCTDEEIAANQGVSIETVKTALQRVYLKLNARNRAHAVAISLHLGYDLDPEHNQN